MTRSIRISSSVLTTKAPRSVGPGGQATLSCPTTATTTKGR